MDKCQVKGCTKKVHQGKHPRFGYNQEFHFLCYFHWENHMIVPELAITEMTGYHEGMDRARKEIKEFLDAQVTVLSCSDFSQQELCHYLNYGELPARGGLP